MCKVVSLYHAFLIVLQDIQDFLISKGRGMILFWSFFLLSPLELSETEIGWDECKGGRPFTHVVFGNFV